MEHHPYWHRANALHDAQDFASALPLWQAIHDALPDDVTAQTGFDVHFKLGDCYDEVDEPGQAVGHYLKAHELAKKLNDDDVVTLLACGISNTAFRSGDYELGETHRAAIWEGLPELGLLGESFRLAQGVAAYEEDKAFELFSEVLANALEYEEVDVMEVAYEQVAGNLLRSKQFNDALAVTASVEGRFEDPNYRCQVVFNELEVYAQRRDGEAYATCYATKVPQLPAASNDLPVTACHRAYYAGVNALFREERAQACFETALAAAGADDSLRFDALTKCYQINTEFYRYTEAKGFVLQALPLAESFGIPYVTLDVAVDYATILLSDNEAQAAKQVLLDQEAGILEEDDPELSLRFYSRLTQCVRQLGDTHTFERSLTAWRGAGEALPRDEAFDFYFELAQTLAGIGQQERANQLLATARTIALETDKAYYLPRVDKERAMLAFQLGYLKEALALLDALVLPKDDPNFMIDYLMLRANVKGDLGDDEVAEQGYWESVDIARQYEELRHHLSPAYCNLGLLYHERKEYAKAEEFYLRGLEIDRELGTKSYEITSLHNLGTVYLDQGRLDLAAVFLWDALALLGQLYGANEASGGRKFTSDEWMNTAEMLAEVLLRQGKPGMALRLLLHRRAAQSGLHSEAVAKLPLPELSDGELLISFSGLRRESFLLFTLDAAGEIRHRQLKLAEDAGLSDDPDLARRVRSFQTKQSRRRGRGVKRYRTDWPWLVAYFNHLCGRMPERSSCALRQRRDALAQRIAARFIWPALVDQKPTALLLQPDYALGLVPFAALPGPEGARPLIADYAIQLLAGVRETSPPVMEPNDLLVFGNTDYSATATTHHPLSSLNGAAAEAAYLAATYPAAEQLVDASAEDWQRLVGDTNALFGYRYLHYLGHADADAYEGGGVFYCPQLPGGVLPAVALAEHRLRAELVYIAACSTGAGRTYAGWGIDSLGKTFLDAGAANVITTLWPLRDRLGPEIVQLFYPALPEQGVAGALAQVQRRLLESKAGAAAPDLYFWAGLVVWGWR